MTKLNQIIALEAGSKEEVGVARGKALAVLAGSGEKAGELFYGMTRTYQARTEIEGDTDVRTEDRADKVVQVRARAEDVLSELAGRMGRLFDLTITKETADAKAKADLVVDGVTLLKEVPVTYLLFLEKQFAKIKEVIAALPVLDPTVKWVLDGNTGLQQSDPIFTESGKKVPRRFVKWQPPSPEYKQEAQVDVWQEDVIVGDWTTVRYSGAVPATRKQQLLDKCDAAIRGIITAREEANSITVEDRNARSLLTWLLS